MAVKEKLKYLFSVIYKDGTQFIQNEEDTSKTVPGGSAFSDVDIDNVFMFNIDGMSVNLLDGKFTPGHFTVGEPGPKPYKLIFWRKHKHTFNVGSTEELSHEVKYLLGYSDADGKEHTITIE